MRKFGAKLLEVLRKGDMVLLALCVLTSVFGIVMVAASTAYDGSSRYVIIQTGALITGILLYLALTAFDIDILAGQRTLLFLFNTAFLAMLLVWGVEGTSGNKSWLHFPFLPFNIQPAEVCKITYIIILAKTMSLNRNRISSLRSVGTLTFHMLWIVALIVVISHDTGVALIFMFLFVVMAYVGGVSGWWFLGGAGAVAAVSPYLWKYFIRDDQKQRILALIDPSIDPDGLGVLWQTNKSLEALRNGGLTGQGLFHGDLTSIGYLPAQHTDSIFSSIGEQLGMLGCPFDAPALGDDGAILRERGLHRVRSLIEWAPYLEELGVGAILLNPVFSSDTHGYNTRNLREIDCRLGTNEDFANVVDALHARGVRVIVDAVFNHVGRNFWAFRDVRERKWDSPYKDWFHINFDGDTHFGDGFW